MTRINLRVALYLHLLESYIGPGEREALYSVPGRIHMKHCASILFQAIRIIWLGHHYNCCMLVLNMVWAVSVSSKSLILGFHTADTFQFRHEVQ